MAHNSILRNARGGTGLEDVLLENIQPKPIETCIFCTEPVEKSPMIRGVCYGCYRSRIVFIGAHNAHELADAKEG